MGSLFLLLGCNLSYIDLFAALHELASASAHTLLKLASSVHALLKPYGDTLNLLFRDVLIAVAVMFCVRSLITNKNDVSRDVRKVTWGCLFLRLAKTRRGLMFLTKFNAKEKGSWRECW